MTNFENLKIAMYWHYHLNQDCYELLEGKEFLTSVDVRRVRSLHCGIVYNGWRIVAALLGFSFDEMRMAWDENISKVTLL